MRKLSGLLNKNKENKSANIDGDDDEVLAQKKVPLTKQQKMFALVAVAVACILVFQLFLVINQRGIRANQAVIQSHIEDQAGAVRNTLSDIIHAEAEQVRKSADSKISELKQMILNSNTEALTQLQQLQMKIDQIQKQTKSLDKVSDELVQKISTRLQQTHVSKPNASQASVSPSSTTPVLSTNKTATNYRIYSANSYGLVLQAENGIYTIATIGKTLSGLGEITSITVNEVIAGDYKIIANPEGFKLNQADAISAY